MIPAPGTVVDPHQCCCVGGSQVVFTLDDGFNYGTSSVNFINIATFPVDFSVIPNVLLGIVIGVQTLLGGSGNAGIVAIGINTNAGAYSGTKWLHNFPNDNIQHGPLTAAGGGALALDPIASFGIPTPVLPGNIGDPVSDQYTVPFINPNPAGLGYIHLGAKGGGNLPPTAFQASGFNLLLLQLIII